MAQFGNGSKKKLSECRVELQVVATDAIKCYDFSVVCGFRGEEAQNAAFRDGYSKLKFPESKHNKTPSQAFDVYPYHKEFGSLTEDASVVETIATKKKITIAAAKQFIREEYCIMAGVILACAKINKVPLRWGGDWDSDGDRLDQSFNDLAHFELDV